jgi:hypothetical protein
MATQKHCVICRRILTSADLEDGLVVHSEAGLVCADCVPQMERKLREAAPSPGATRDWKENEPAGFRGGNAMKRPNEAKSGQDIYPTHSMAKGIYPTPVEKLLSQSEPLLGAKAKSDDSSADEILDELRSINRALVFERSSVWNVLGGVAQVFVPAIVALAAMNWDQPTNMLLLAVLVQLIALTFFVKGR